VICRNKRREYKADDKIAGPPKQGTVASLGHLWTIVHCTYWLPIVGTSMFGCALTTRIGALHDRLHWSQIVENTSWLTYDDDQRIRHVSHVIDLLEQLYPSSIDMFFRHGSLARNNRNRLIVMNWTVIEIGTSHHLPCHLLMLDVMWLLPCRVSTQQ
jgi:hypothetical protein